MVEGGVEMEEKPLFVEEAEEDVRRAAGERPKLANRRSVIARLEGATSSWMNKITLVLVRRPKGVIFGIIGVMVVQMAIVAASNFSLSRPTEYDWEVPYDKFTILRDMMVDAQDSSDDAAALKTRGDATFPWYFMYDAEPKFRDTCERPYGILTARNVQAMCEAERVLTSQPSFGDYCVLDDDGACATLAYSVLQLFYEANETASCPLLAQARVDEGWAAMESQPEAHYFFVDEGAFERGFPCRTRSIVYAGSPLEGYADLAKNDDNQFERVSSNLAEDAEADLWDYYDMTGHFLKSTYDDRARAGESGDKFSVIWYSPFTEKFEWARLVNEDFMVAFGSVVFVWFYISKHTGSLFVGSMAMLQITLSLPLSLFWYRCVFWIRYFSTMQMLVIFVILGIGADDVFVFSDAWHQAAPISGPRPPADDPALTEAYLHKRLKYAYVRALQSMMNTSFTTAVAFLATGIHPVMPISTFGIYAAICVLVNYVLAMTMTPAILVLHDRLKARRSCCFGKPCLPCAAASSSPQEKDDDDGKARETEASASDYEGGRAVEAYLAAAE